MVPTNQDSTQDLSPNDLQSNPGPEPQCCRGLRSDINAADLMYERSGSVSAGLVRFSPHSVSDGLVLDFHFNFNSF